ncbi:MAG: hypothetical protein KGZ70_12955 [Hydrogenophaga sp.]|nr:hypothetical protein [Hydrogenophaga sp.]
MTTIIYFEFAQDRMIFMEGLAFGKAAHQKPKEGSDSNGFYLEFDDPAGHSRKVMKQTPSGLQLVESLEKYAVQLSEPTEGEEGPFVHTFECFAESESHAVEQARNAYPEDEILGAGRTPPRTSTPSWYAFSDDRLVPLGRHSTFEEADASAPGQTHWLFNEQSLQRFVELAIAILPAPIITSVPVQHWSVADGSSEKGANLPNFSLEVTDQRVLNNSFYVDVIPNEADDIGQMRAAFEINNLIEGKEHLPCAHFHFNSDHLAFSLFKRRDQYIVRPENQVQLKPTTLPDGTHAFVISE